MTQNLQNWIGDILTLADLGQSSGAELVRHLLVESIRILEYNYYKNLLLKENEILHVNFINS